MKRLNQSGFTLIELMLALTLFSLVMIIATAGFIGISRTYNRSLIRKNLSEADQAFTSDVTSTLRSNGQAVTPTTCLANGTGPNCPSPVDPVWSRICFSNTRYVWKADGGLFKNQAPCTSSISATNPGQVLLDPSRFKVGVLYITSAGVHLFNIEGVFRTVDDNAFYRVNELSNPSSVKCLGTAQTTLSRTCAVDYFNYVVNTRGTK